MSDHVATIPPILAIVGPTASGKSAVAMEVAEAVEGEIVACDSVQVYRGFNIGTAKPTQVEQARVPHHLIDVADPQEPFDAQRYSELARAAIHTIQARGKVPIVCGGTGLYLRALRFGLVDAPPANPTLRADLMAQEARTPGALYARLQSIDPVSARSLEPRNTVHVLRALEICLEAGEPASALRARHGFRVPALPMDIVALDWPDEALRRRIAERTQAMLQAGLLDEVQALMRAGVPTTCQPMKAVGYREACAALLAHGSQLSRLSQKAAVETELHSAIVKSTWHYVRRQRTWMRREQRSQTPYVQMQVQSPATTARAIVKHLRGTA